MAYEEIKNKMPIKLTKWEWSTVWVFLDASNDTYRSSGEIINIWDAVKGTFEIDGISFGLV